jgi:hypothetical protein
LRHPNATFLAKLKFVRLPREIRMNRVELLEAASMKLAEAVLLLTEAGEQHIATSAGELAEIVEFRAGAAPATDCLDSIRPR